HCHPPVKSPARWLLRARRARCYAASRRCPEIAAHPIIRGIGRGGNTKATPGAGRLPVPSIRITPRTTGRGTARFPRAPRRAFCSPYQKPSLLVMRRQNLAALGYGREHTHSILSMALREFSNEMRLYGG